MADVVMDCPLTTGILASFLGFLLSKLAVSNYPQRSSDSTSTWVSGAVSKNLPNIGEGGMGFVAHFADSKRKVVALTT